MNTEVEAPGIWFRRGNEEPESVAKGIENGRSVGTGNSGLGAIHSEFDFILNELN
jgi:hypothetical protein